MVFGGVGPRPGWGVGRTVEQGGCVSVQVRLACPSWCVAASGMIKVSGRRGQAHLKTVAGVVCGGNAVRTL